MVMELHSPSERWFQAWLEKDAATVERLAAEDYSDEWHIKSADKSEYSLSGRFTSDPPSLARHHLFQFVLPTRIPMLKRITALVLLLSFVVSGDSQAREVPKVIASGDWSKPVADNRGFSVRGRLLLCETERGDDKHEVAVYVELQDASDSRGGSMELFCDFGGLTFELQDSDKKPVKSTPSAFGGGVPNPKWVILPSDSTIRLRTSPYGSGTTNMKALAVAPTLSGRWMIDESDKSEYFLSGTLPIDPAQDNKPPADGNVWRGTIVFPAVRIVNWAPRIDAAIAFIKERYKVPASRIDDRTVGIIWEAVGENKAFRELKEHVQKEFELEVKISAVE